MSNKRFTEEFKIEAVRQIVDRGYSVAETTRRLGNVLEWVADCYSENYTRSPLHGSPQGVDYCPNGVGVVRGGSYISEPEWVRSTVKYGVERSVRGDNFGLRVARKIP